VEFDGVLMEILAFILTMLIALFVVNAMLMWWARR
jgi:uncharacterized iron-regulated membrane protein